MVSGTKVRDQPHIEGIPTGTWPGNAQSFCCGWRDIVGTVVLDVAAKKCPLYVPLANGPALSLPYALVCKTT